jgi:hypothetical protein
LPVEAGSNGEMPLDAEAGATQLLDAIDAAIIANGDALAEQSEITTPASSVVEPPAQGE